MSSVLVQVRDSLGSRHLDYTVKCDGEGAVAGQTLFYMSDGDHVLVRQGATRWAGRGLSGFGADDFAVNEEVKTRFFGITSAAYLEGEKGFVYHEVFGNGFASGSRVFVKSGEIAIADDARNDGTHLLVREGFGCGRCFVPAVSGECPAVETACLEVEENGVFSWRGGLRVGRLGGRKGGKGEQGKDESETVKARVGEHCGLSLQTMRAMRVDYTGKLGEFMN